MKQIKEHIAGIIFDMDGTIIDTEHVWQKAVAELLVQNNVLEIPQDKAFIFDLLRGAGLHGCVDILRENLPIRMTHDECVTFIVTEAKRLITEEIRYIQGFEAFHNRLREHGIPTSIATNCDAESLQRIVDKMDFTKHFGENIFCVAHVNNKAKPNPDLFLHAAAKLGVKPEQCIVFEDSIQGFQAAKAAGILCIGIANKSNAEHLQEHTHGSIANYDEAEAALIKLIEQHWKKA